MNLRLCPSSLQVVLSTVLMFSGWIIIEHYEKCLYFSLVIRQTWTDMKSKTVVMYPAYLSLATILHRRIVYANSPG